ncbi:TIGR00730 family Rossman fold protein [Altererythrobacter sp. Root672]|uniref:LOG family protein n=1 Tax=Altererythrobacter sp. Root672 TaxID=1736584 RepID=UPI0006FAC090|nr:TIGR00730 family Rossman fold protein [Altererythrobacter sp. Root672]KRA79406.1 decarboxylase [Altererythrobacter sp. Root672]
MKRLAVYCGSASPADPRYEELAMDVGKALALRGIGVVYGGGKLGLMGAVAAGALLEGGEVVGVIPDALVKAEVANKACTELHVVSTMHERKEAFTDLSDGFLTLPGGVGTMDELWEALSWAQLGYHAKPVGLLNAYGFYDGLIEFYHRMGESGFIRAEHRSVLIQNTELDPLLASMESYVPHRPIFRMTAEEL